MDGSASKSLEPNSSVRFDELEEGTLSVELSSLDEGSAVDGDSPQSVTITAGVTATIAFIVVCEPVAPEVEGIIAFTKVVDQNFEVFTMNTDGSNQQRLTNNGVQDNDAVFSPDGTKIAYMSQSPQSANYAIWVMDIDGSNKIQLTPYTSNNRFPSWSPNGSYLAFTELTSGSSGSAIWIVKTDGTAPYRLTDPETTSSTYPNWGPDTQP